MTSRTTLLAAFLLALTALPAPGQTPEQDSVEVPLHQLQEMREEVQMLRHRDSVRADIIRNLRSQISALERVRRSDSTIAQAQKERLRVRDERLRWKREQVDYWRERAEAQRRRKWYLIGGASLVFVLGAVAGS
jgi:hypothetical protein